MKSRLRQKIWRVSLSVLLATLLPVSAAAQSALVFERAAITIESPPPNPNDKAPKPGHPPLHYDVELRPEEALRLEYIHALNTLGDGTGVMINFNAPTIVALPAMKAYTPVDALFLAEDGTVMQITPNVTLGEMAYEVRARAPVRAFLFLKAGEAAARGIHPRDHVSGSMFVAAPTVQE